MRILWIVWIVCLTGCSPVTLEDLRCQGETETRQLAQVLRELETREEVQKALPSIKRRFNRIAALLLEVRKFPNSSPLVLTVAGEELFIELSRLYEIPGVRACIESAEEEAVHLLSKEP